MESDYTNLILELVENFKKNIPETEEEGEKLVKGFKRYLEIGVKEIQNPDFKYSTRNPETVKRFIRREAENMSKMDITSLKRKLIEDTPFERLRITSNEIFAQAIKKKNGENLDKEYDYDGIINEFDELLTKVAPYNLDKAREFVSEAVLDLNYICKSRDDVSSLRLYHFTKSLEQRDKKEER